MAGLLQAALQAVGLGTLPAPWDTVAMGALACAAVAAAAAVGLAAALGAVVLYMTCGKPRIAGPPLGTLGARFKAEREQVRAPHPSTLFAVHHAALGPPPADVRPGTARKRRVDGTV